MTPKSSKNVMVSGDPVLVYVSAPPADGEANKAVVDVVSKSLRIPKSRIEVTKGLTSRNKTLTVQGLTASELASKLSTLA